jgi:transcriptional regulator NrdR family protein
MNTRGKRKPLVCPACGSVFSRVKDSGDPVERHRRWADVELQGLWRLRECLRCKALYNTTETVRGLYGS